MNAQVETHAAAVMKGWVSSGMRQEDGKENSIKFSFLRISICLKALESPLIETSAWSFKDWGGGREGAGHSGEIKHTQKKSLNG